MKPKIFVDFDDTLFDKQKFWPDLVEIFKRPGLDKNGPALFTDEEISVSYKAVYTDGYAGAEAQLIYMHNTYPEKKFDLEAALAELSQLMSEIKDKYLFPGAIEYIEELKENYDVYLITVGGLEFQKAKVKNSGIEELVGEDHCLYTEGSKEQKLLDEKIQSEDEFTLVEDKKKTIRSVYATFPNAKFVLAGQGQFREIPEEELVAEYGEERELRVA